MYNTGTERNNVHRPKLKKKCTSLKNQCHGPIQNKNEVLLFASGAVMEAATGVQFRKGRFMNEYQVPE